MLVDDRPIREVPQVAEGVWPKLTVRRRKNLEGMLAAYEATGERLQARCGTFPVWTPPPGLRYSKEAKLALAIPAKAERFVERRYQSDGVRIVILLGGSKHAVAYPSIRSWAKIIQAFNEAFPGCHVYLTGVREQQAGRTLTRAFGAGSLAYLLRRFDNLTDCYDIGLWNQIALLRSASFFLSPHTGFGFLAPCVDTPWLTLSGGNWAEYFFNQVPFYSVLPDDPNFPYRNRFPHLHYRFKRSGKILPMQPEKIDAKIPEIVHAAQLLINPAFTYKRALVEHRRNVQRAMVDRELIPLGPAF